VRDENLRAILDDFLVRFKSGCPLTDNGKLILIKTTTDIALLAVRLDSDNPSSILRYNGYIKLEDLPEPAPKRLRRNAEKAPNSGLGFVYSSPKRGNT